MLNKLIQKISNYIKTNLCKNLSKKEKTSNHTNAGSLTDIMVMLMNRTPAEEEVIMQRVMNMAKFMVNPYIEEKVNDSVSKFTHIVTNEDYYYEVEKIKMNQEQYQQYLDKKALNEKLHKKLSARKNEKRAKL